MNTFSSCHFWIYMGFITYLFISLNTGGQKNAQWKLFPISELLVPYSLFFGLLVLKFRQRIHTQFTTRKQRAEFLFEQIHFNCVFLTFCYHNVLKGNTHTKQAASCGVAPRQKQNGRNSVERIHVLQFYVLIKFIIQ